MVSPPRITFLHPEKSSAKIVFRVTNILTQFKKSFSKFNLICTKNKDYNIEIITTMDLADLYTAVVESASAQEIPNQGDFTKKVVVSK